MKGTEFDMRRVVIYTLSSLDGSVEDPSRYFPDTGERQGPPVFDDDLIRLEAAMTERQDAVLLGRRMYDEWSGYWPTSDEQPFADFINNVKKYVVTSTPLSREWTNAEPVAAPLAGLVGKLKAEPGGDIGVHGSITLARSLLRDGLADELNLVVGRVIDPEGPRLFESIGSLLELNLMSATPTSNGSVWLRYQT
jgi:dihydrofolate reductase